MGIFKFKIKSLSSKSNNKSELRKNGTSNRRGRIVHHPQVNYDRQKQ